MWARCFVFFVVKYCQDDWHWLRVFPSSNSWISNLFCLIKLSWGSIFWWHSWCTMYLICTDSHQTFDDAIMDVARKVAKYKDTKSKQNGRLKKTHRFKISLATHYNWEYHKDFLEKKTKLSKAFLFMCYQQSGNGFGSLMLSG